jgi:hypothetical protein
MAEETGRHDTFPLQPRGVSEILGAAFQLYRQHWATLTTIAAVVVVPLTLVQYYLADLVRVEAPTQAEIEALGVEAISPDFWRATLAAAFVGILSIFILQVLTGAVARGAAGSILGERLTVGQAYRYGFVRLWSILLVGVLVGLAVFAGLILLVIPGIFVLVRLIVSIPALVIENRRGGAALSRSWNLVRGHWWPVFGTILLAGLIIGVVTGILTLPFDEGWFGQAVAAALGSVVTTPFFALVTLLIYLDLRTRKEELDAAVLRRDYEAAGVDRA